MLVKAGREAGRTILELCPEVVRARPSLTMKFASPSPGATGELNRQQGRSTPPGWLQDQPGAIATIVFTMHTTKVNPILSLAAFGAIVASQALRIGQIAERRWTAQEVADELGLSRVSQWEWRRDGKLDCLHVGTRIYYTTSQLQEAGLL